MYFDRVPLVQFAFQGLNMMLLGSFQPTHMKNNRGNSVKVAQLTYRMPRPLSCCCSLGQTNRVAHCLTMTATVWKTCPTMFLHNFGHRRPPNGNWIYHIPCKCCRPPLAAESFRGLWLPELRVECSRPPLDPESCHAEASAPRARLIRRVSSGLLSLREFSRPPLTGARGNCTPWSGDSSLHGA